LGLVLPEVATALYRCKALSLVGTGGELLVIQIFRRVARLIGDVE
jgi:hypothetical protein